MSPKRSAPASAPSPISVVTLEPSPSPDANRCRHLTAHRRRCTMLRSDSHPSLCPYHARRERLLLEADQTAADLVASFGELHTANDINRALAKTFSLLSQDRIPRRKALALAYLGQLLLQSLSEVRFEIGYAYGSDATHRLLRQRLERLFVRSQVTSNPGLPHPDTPSR